MAFHRLAVHPWCGGNTAHQRRTGRYHLDVSAFAVIDQTLLVDFWRALRGLGNQFFKHGACAVLQRHPFGQGDVLTLTQLAHQLDRRLVNAKGYTGRGQGPGHVLHGGGFATVWWLDADLGAHVVGRELDLDAGITPLRHHDTKRLLLVIALSGRVGKGIVLPPALAKARLLKQGQQVGSADRGTPRYRMGHQENLSIGFVERNTCNTHGRERVERWLWSAPSECQTPF